MKANYIHRRYTLLSCFYISFLAGLFVCGLGFVIVAASGADPRIAFLTGITTGLLLMIYMISAQAATGRRLLNRIAALAAIADRLGLKAMPTWQPEPLTLSSIHEVADRDQKFTNVYKSPDWEYADMEYAYYQQSRSGEYKAATMYYAVMSTELSRVLPNILFDSNKLRGKQFKRVFARGQEHRLEGGFEEHFTTYFAEDYTIDSMSFITPEVMEALVAANEYDIEIAGKWLLLYGPMYEPEQQIADMSASIMNIKKNLLDNIDTYRDERLPYEAGRVTVTEKGMRLKRRDLSIWLIIGVIVYWILSIAAESFEFFN